MKRKYPEKTHHYIDQHGKSRFYLRRPGHKKIPLPGLPWSPEFMAAREAALNGDWGKAEIGAKRTVAGTVNAALVSYYQSSAFNDGLKESSRRMRRAILERFREQHGDKPIALMHKKALQTILNKKSPAAASNWRKALRSFIDHAMSLDMLTVDPLAGIKLVPFSSDGHHPWEMEECAMFEAHHKIGTRARLSEQLSALDDAHFLGPAGRGALQHGEDGRCGVAQRIWRVRSANARGHEERGKQIAGPGRADRQFRRTHAPGLGPFDGKGLDLAVRRVGELGAGDDDRRWTARRESLRLRDHLIDCRGLRPAQPFELEMIGGDEVRKRAQSVTHERRDVGLDEQASVAIPEHGITTIEQGGIAGLGSLDEVRDHGGDLRRAEITRQDHPAGVERAALLDPQQQIGDQLCVEHPAADGRVTRPIAQQGGGHRDHVDAVHLHGKDGGAVADMAVGDLRLNRNHGHAVGRRNIRCP